MSEHGFVDLRLNHQRDQTAESFWPSFTDVMTVIVMIFLLAVLIVLARNVELVAELRATMEAERQAAELARARDRQRVQLAGHLDAAEEEITRLSRELGALENARREQDRLLAKERSLSAALDVEKAALGEELAGQRKRAEELMAALDDVRRRLRKLEVNYNALEVRHQQSETALSELEGEHLQLQQRHAERADTIASLEAQTDTRQRRIDRLAAERSDLSAEIERLRAERRAAERSLGEYREELETLAAAEAAQRAELERLQAQRSADDRELEELRAAYQARARELAAVLDRLEASDQAKTELEQDYDELAQRYAKLVRPARSPKGRYVVEVRYAKPAGRPDIRIREPGEERFRSVSRAALEARLAALNRDHREGLYVKVIFPENSGLSYNEAWRFTNALHGKYDYYYREQPAAHEGDTGP
jgi:septal ring factor EnvC (AmiA/AmiB activator)